MADTFGTATAEIAATATDIISDTITGSATTIVLMIKVSNIHSSSSSTVDVYVYDSSATDTRYLCKGVTIPAGTALSVLSPGEKLVLEDADELRAVAGTASVLEAVASYLKRT